MEKVKGPKKKDLACISKGCCASSTTFPKEHVKRLRHNRRLSQSLDLKIILRN
jgi:hypothetical protein